MQAGNNQIKITFKDPLANNYIIKVAPSTKIRSIFPAMLANWGQPADSILTVYKLDEEDAIESDTLINQIADGNQSIELFCIVDNSNLEYQREIIQLTIDNMKVLAARSGTMQCPTPLPANPPPSIMACYTRASYVYQNKEIIHQRYFYPFNLQLIAHAIKYLDRNGAGRANTDAIQRFCDTFHHQQQFSIRHMLPLIIETIIDQPDMNYEQLTTYLKYLHNDRLPIGVVLKELAGNSECSTVHPHLIHSVLKDMFRNPIPWNKFHTRLLKPQVGIPEKIRGYQDLLLTGLISNNKSTVISVIVGANDWMSAPLIHMWSSDQRTTIKICESMLIMLQFLTNHSTYNSSKSAYYQGVVNVLNGLKENSTLMSVMLAAAIGCMPVPDPGQQLTAGDKKILELIYLHITPNLSAETLSDLASNNQKAKDVFDSCITQINDKQSHRSLSLFSTNDSQTLNAAKDALVQAITPQPSAELGDSDDDSDDGFVIVPQPNQ